MQNSHIIKINNLICSLDLASLSQSLPEGLDYGNFLSKDNFLAFLKSAKNKKFYPLLWNESSCNSCFKKKSRNEVEVYSFIAVNRKLRVFDLAFTKDELNILIGITYCEFGLNSLYPYLKFGTHQDYNDGTSTAPFDIKEFL